MSAKRQKPPNIKNFGKDHHRKKFNKGNVNQPAQSLIGSKPMELKNKNSNGVQEREPFECWDCG